MIVEKKVERASQQQIHSNVRVVNRILKKAQPLFSSIIARSVLLKIGLVKRSLQWWTMGLNHGVLHVSQSVEKRSEKPRGEDNLSRGPSSSQTGRQGVPSAYPSRQRAPHCSDFTGFVVPSAVEVLSVVHSNKEIQRGPYQ